MLQCSVKMLQCSVQRNGNYFLRMYGDARKQNMS